jgi:hypothetical protein
MRIKIKQPQMILKKVIIDPQIIQIIAQIVKNKKNIFGHKTSKKNVNNRPKPR